MLSCPEVGKFASIQGCNKWRPTEVDVELIADAPLLLAEVKRLRNILRTVSIDIRPQDMGDSVEWYQKLREEYGGEVE